jgi:hypothetical protein
LNRTKVFATHPVSSYMTENAVANYSGSKVPMDKTAISGLVYSMSLLPAKADVRWTGRHLREVPHADSCAAATMLFRSITSPAGAQRSAGYLTLSNPIEF